MGATTILSTPTFKSPKRLNIIGIFSKLRLTSGTTFSPSHHPELGEWVETREPDVAPGKSFSPTGKTASSAPKPDPRDKSLCKCVKKIKYCEFLKEIESCQRVSWKK